MKKLILTILLLGLTLSASLKLNIDNSIIINPGQKIQIPLSCAGSVGQVAYNIRGLPKGLSLLNGVIQGTNEANSGYYPVLIDARDQKNNFISQIVVFKIGPGSASQITVNNGQTITSTTLNSGGGATITTVLGSNANTQGQFGQVFNQQNNQMGGINNINNGMGGSFNSGNMMNSNNQGLNGNQNIPSINVNVGNAFPNQGFPNTNFPNSNQPILNPTFPNFNQPNQPTQPGNNFPNSNQPNPNNPNSGFPSNPSMPGSPANPNFPSDSNPAGQQPTIDNLLNKFAPSSPSQMPYNQPNNPANNQRSYPTPNLPMGGNPNSPPNTTPMLIDAAKAPRLPTDKNKITPDSVKATAIFQRQLNANKAIANLLDIIEQLTANANAAKADIPVLDGQVKNALAVQRNVQGKIITAQNQRTRLNTAINNLNDNINLLRKQLSDLETSFKDSTQSVTTKKTQLGNLLQTINKYEDSAKEVNNKVVKQKDLMTSIDTQIKDSQNDIQATKQELDKKTKEASNIDADIENAVRNIKNIDDQIADLKARLNSAITRKTQGEQEEKRLRNIKVNAPIITAQLQNKILKGTQNLDKLNEQKQGAAASLTQMNSNLDEINLNLDRTKSQFNQVETEIKVVTGNRKDYDDAIAAKNKQITDAIANLQFLKGQVDSYDTALRTAYNEGNDANTRVQNAKQNLDALVKKWEKDSQSLSQATLNLEKARAEKQLSDLAMQQLLRQRSSALPYSIVPNGNGMTNAGTPTGNNPRGSPLGPLALNNLQNSDNPFSQQANSISSYSNYLSSAYAQGVDPAIPSTVTRSFPFTIYRSPNSGNNGNIGNTNAQLRNQNTNLNNGLNSGFNAGLNGNNLYNNFNGNLNLGSLIPITNVDGQQIGGLAQDGEGNLYYTGDFNCGSAPSDLIEGVIKGLGNNALRVQANNGRMYIVKVGSCSQAIANTPNYSISVGDKIKFSGQSSGMGVMNLYQASCECSKCPAQN